MILDESIKRLEAELSPSVQLALVEAELSPSVQLALEKYRNENKDAPEEVGYRKSKEQLRKENKEARDKIKPKLILLLHRNKPEFKALFSQLYKKINFEKDTNKDDLLTYSVMAEIYKKNRDYKTSFVIKDQIAKANKENDVFNALEKEFSQLKKPIDDRRRQILALNMKIADTPNTDENEKNIEAYEAKIASLEKEIENLSNSPDFKKKAMEIDYLKDSQEKFKATATELRNIKDARERLANEKKEMDSRLDREAKDAEEWKDNRTMHEFNVSESESVKTLGQKTVELLHLFPSMDPNDPETVDFRKTTPDGKNMKLEENRKLAFNKFEEFKKELDALEDKIQGTKFEDKYEELFKRAEDLYSIGKEKLSKGNTMILELFRNKTIFPFYKYLARTFDLSYMTKDGEVKDDISGEGDVKSIDRKKIPDLYNNIRDPTKRFVKVYEASEMQLGKDHNASAIILSKDGVQKKVTQEELREKGVSLSRLLHMGVKLVGFEVNTRGKMIPVKYLPTEEAVSMLKKMHDDAKKSGSQYDVLSAKAKYIDDINSNSEKENDFNNYSLIIIKGKVYAVDKSAVNFGYVPGKEIKKRADYKESMRAYSRMSDEEKKNAKKPAMNLHLIDKNLRGPLADYIAKPGEGLASMDDQFINSMEKRTNDKGIVNKNTIGAKGEDIVLLNGEKITPFNIGGKAAAELCKAARSVFEKNHLKYFRVSSGSTSNAYVKFMIPKEALDYKAALSDTLRKKIDDADSESFDRNGNLWAMMQEPNFKGRSTGTVTRASVTGVLGKLCEKVPSSELVKDSGEVPIKESYYFMY